jgi:hypothetical protein
MKKKTKNISVITPGGMKNKFIWNTFTSIIILTIGPSIISMNTNANVLSNIPKSLENLLINLPVGVVSK